MRFDVIFGGGVTTVPYGKKAVFFFLVEKNGKGGGRGIDPGVAVPQVPSCQVMSDSRSF